MDISMLEQELNSLSAFVDRLFDRLMELEDRIENLEAKENKEQDNG